VPGGIGHNDMLGAIGAKQPAGARRAMEVHIDDWRNKMIKLFWRLGEREGVSLASGCHRKAINPKAG
jgi:hypothetical protein